MLKLEKGLFSYTKLESKKPLKCWGSGVRVGITKVNNTKQTNKKTVPYSRNSSSQHKGLGLPSVQGWAGLQGNLS